MRTAADDDASMAADNTSGFNCRSVAGSNRPDGRRTRTARPSTSTPSRTRTSPASLRFAAHGRRLPRPRQPPARHGCTRHRAEQHVRVGRLVLGWAMGPRPTTSTSRRTADRFRCMAEVNRDAACASCVAPRSSGSSTRTRDRCALFERAKATARRRRADELDAAVAGRVPDLRRRGARRALRRRRRAQLRRLLPRRHRAR